MLRSELVTNYAEVITNWYLQGSGIGILSLSFTGQLSYRTLQYGQPQKFLPPENFLPPSTTSKEAHIYFLSTSFCVFLFINYHLRYPKRGTEIINRRMFEYILCRPSMIKRVLRQQNLYAIYGYYEGPRSLYLNHLIVKPK